MTGRAERRWPRWVFATGSEPDYRFSLANERTFLAWLRTSLACLAAGVALSVVDVQAPTWAARWLSSYFVAIGTVLPFAAWLRWAASERAIRASTALPSMGWLAFTAMAVALPTCVWALAA